jgi:hypothetical protein
MLDIEEVHCTVAITAVLEANLQLMDATVAESLQSFRYGKADTLGLDVIPERIIANSLGNFDSGAVLVTEEAGGSFLSSRFSSGGNPTFYISDPTDRSSQLRGFLADHQSKKKVGEVILETNTQADWEAKCGAPASITGATSAITCIRHGAPISSAIVNFITQELFVTFRAGSFRLRLPNYEDLDVSRITLDYLRAHGEPILFRNLERPGQKRADWMRYFVTFLGGVGKEGYLENLRDSGLMSEEDRETYLRYGKPGGPTRPLYLSTVQPEDVPVGFILANGEKIGEWIHWLPLVRFGKSQSDPAKTALCLYEVYQERPWTKEGILMSTPPPYSIFSETAEHSGEFFIDVGKLRSFPNPSRVRSTLLLAPIANTWGTTVAERNVFRRIRFPDRY